MLADPLRRVSTFMAGRRVLPPRHMETTIWISPLFCGGRRHEIVTNLRTKKAPAARVGAFVFR